ncbi:hypothetical protein R6Z07F_018370 [Ovis aries]
MTLCPAFIFPDRDEKHRSTLFLLSICTDEQNGSDENSEKAVKLREQPWGTNSVPHLGSCQLLHHIQPIVQTPLRSLLELLSLDSVPG